MITRFLLAQAGLKADEAASCTVTLIQRFRSVASYSDIATRRNWAGG